MQISATAIYHQQKNQITVGVVFMAKGDFYLFLIY